MCTCKLLKMTIANFAYFFILFVYASGASNSSTSSASQKKCSEEEFPKPYIVLYSRKNGPEVSKLETQGVIDLRNAVRSYVCINGLVIIYKNVHVEKGKGKGSSSHPLKNIITINPGEIVTFHKASIRNFAHKCMTINWVEKEDTNTKIFDSNFKKPVLGIKAAGMFLITTPEPFTPSHPPIKIMLNKKGFGYSIGHPEISDASFVASGKGPYCISLPDGSKIILSSNSAQNDTSICRWGLHDQEQSSRLYKRFFRRHYNRADYKWVECGPDDAKNASGNATEDGDYFTHGPFATYEKPNQNYHPPKLSGGSKQETREFSGSAENSDRSHLEGGDGAAAKVFAIPLGDCVEPPKFNPNDPTCEFLNSSECPKLSAALELLSVDADAYYKKAGTPEEDSNTLLLDMHPKLKWKREVLTLVATIFSKICLPIRKLSVFQLMRVIDNYIATAHTSNPESPPYNKFVEKTGIWDILIAGLTRCKNCDMTRPMEWEWSGTPKITTYTSDSRVKREVSETANAEQILETIILESEEAEQNEDPQRLLIQRSPPVFDLNDDDEATNEFVYGTIPRWRRDAGLENLPLPVIQEYVSPTQSAEKGPGSEYKMTHQDFIIFPGGSNLRLKGNESKEIFYYRDVSEIVYELNPVIDSFWKVLATVMGYCQWYEKSRENGIYPLLFHKFEEYFLNLLKQQWKEPEVPEELEMVMGEFLDEDRSQWLDTCVESAYIKTNDALKFRPPRPIELEGNSEGMKFREMKSNKFIDIPEDKKDRDRYFLRLNNIKGLQEEHNHPPT